MSIFGNTGWIEDTVTATFGRLCTGPIQTGSSISGDSIVRRTLLEQFEKGGDQMAIHLNPQQFVSSK